MSATNDAAARSSQTLEVANMVPDIINELVERFERNRSQYRTATYNEAQVRREFIDPFFEALGGGVNNRQGYAKGGYDPGKVSS